MGFLICCIITPLLALATAYFVGEKAAFVVIVLGIIIGMVVADGEEHEL